ncbi:MAG: VTT domain-containing protein [Casimicrobiaceae bacterium]
MPEFLELALHFDRHLGSVIAEHGTLVYLLLFAIVFVEIAFLPLFFLPGDPLIFICGAFCAKGGLDIRITLPVLFAATVAGSLVNFGIGLRIGENVDRHQYRWLNRDALDRTRAFFETWGRWTFLVSPFLAVIRTFAPFVAGVARMSPGRFVTSVTAGAALWVLVLVPAGYWFGNIPIVHDHLAAIVLAGIGLGTGSLLVTMLWRRVRRRR